ncbi:hypothetical protein ACT4U1_11285 [Acinetobacter baumannii]|uniref:hypothetical protein n=1 Tax=Acinetobacter baumannii TaxID=470 RepID=UPI0023403A59|nr:hypothetical protein [Acinetobacter baumannii]HEO1766730.1 hypothetical protein [Acinetobacter baumannii]
MINITSFYDQEPNKKQQQAIATTVVSSDKYFFDIQKRDNEYRIAENANSSVQKILLNLK